MKSIPGAEVISSIDSLKLQVCVRQGTQVVIHPDQARQWSSSGEEIAALFSKLKSEHEAKYLNALATVIAESSTSPASTAAAVVEAEDPVADDTAAPDASPAPDPVVFTSEEELKKADQIKERCASEIAGVELLRGESGKLYILCEKNKVLCKWSVLGGYGTGKFLNNHMT